MVAIPAEKFTISEFRDLIWQIHTAQGQMQQYALLNEFMQQLLQNPDLFSEHPDIATNVQRHLIEATEIAGTLVLSRHLTFEIAAITTQWAQQVFALILNIPQEMMSAAELYSSGKRMRNYLSGMLVSQFATVRCA
jgi:hypothetical protein